MNCLTHLSKQLKANMLNCPHHSATREAMLENLRDGEEIVLASLGYAAAFWAQHLDLAKDTSIVRDALADDGFVKNFLDAHILEWLECLSLLNQLPRAVDALKTLASLSTGAANTLTGHLQYIEAMTLSLNGQRIVSADAGGTIKVWNATTGETMKTIQLVDTNATYSLACSGDGQLIVPPSSSNIRLLNAGTGSVERTLVGHSDTVLAVAISHDDQRIASGSRDNSVRLWDADKGLVENTLVGHSDEVWAVAFSPDSRRIASGSEDGTIKLWETLAGEAKTLIGHEDNVTAVAFSPTGRRIVSGSSDMTVRVWDTTTALVEKVLIGHKDGVHSVAFSPIGHLIASGSDHTIRLWDTTTWELQDTLVGHTGTVNDVAFFATGQRIVSSSYDSTMKIWDTSVKGLQRDVPVNYRNKYGSIAFSPNGCQIAYGSKEDSTVIVWDIKKGTVRTTLVGHTDYVTAVAFSSDGQQMVSASPTVIKIWDVDTRVNKATLVDHKIPKYRDDYPNDVAFLPDGRSILSLSAHHIAKVWNILTRDVKALRDCYSIDRPVLALSRNGRWLASRSRRNNKSTTNSIKLFDLAQSLNTEGELLELQMSQEIEISASVSWFDFSTDSDYLATNRGIYRVGGTTIERSSQELDASQFLYVYRQWIKCGQTPVLRIPPDFPLARYNVNGDQVAIRFYGGEILIITIDRRAFLSAATT
ncbi:hypothetical protein LTR70_003966 [Exophiala xenobiotica]|uniref:Mitochondrial division protein 1 n=1 Tax=Lithohypha guttulata TaxID=1690604 RepID=A0ABR0K9K3_9EURO|nr:hypothetical protein LTR24_005270 [Lithohypha guttulata]KAK5322119.1 hypothetical protein LTR70_003966 [Exophiala xenobiotica]